MSVMLLSKVQCDIDAIDRMAALVRCITGFRASQELNGVSNEVQTA